MEPIIFFSSPPVLEDLCALTVQVKAAPPCKTISQPHVLKCREFIFSESSIIASPSFDLDYCFNIIIQISLFKTGRLQGRMQKLGLEFSKPFRVHPTLYQSCLRYTLTARLAPSWNKAGEWHIQGRDFVTQCGYTNAVKVNLCVNNNEIFASLCGTVLRSPPLQVEDLNLSRQEMLDILKSTQEDGRQVELHDSWCHVLPSMKRGRILSVSLLMPSWSPFSGYNELKRYWKNTYGYRLPETDEDILYCQVTFSPSGSGKQFTYPDTCLRNRPAQCMSRVDCKPILSSFILDVHARIGQVCGQPLRFTPKMHFTSLALHDADEEVTHASLSNKRNFKKENTKVPLRSSQNIMHMKRKPSTQDQPSLRAKLVEQTGIDASSLSTVDKGNDITDKNIVNTNSNLSDQRNINSQIETHPNYHENRSNTEQKVNSLTKPISSPHPKMMDRNQIHSPLKHNQTIVDPTSNTEKSSFNTKNQTMKLSLPNSETANTANRSSTQTRQTPTNTLTTPPLLPSTSTSTSTPTTPQAKLVPIFWPRKRNSANTVAIKASTKTDNTTPTSKFVPVFKPTRPPSSSTVKTASNLNSNLRESKTHKNSLTLKTPSKTPYATTSSSPHSNITNSKKKSTTSPFPTQSSQPITTQQRPMFPVFKPTSKSPITSHKLSTTSTKPSSQSAQFRQTKSHNSTPAVSNSPHPSPSLPLRLSQSIAKSCTSTPKAVPQFSSKELQLPTEHSASNQWKGKANSLPSMSASYHHDMNTSMSPNPCFGFGSKSTPVNATTVKRKIEMAQQEPSTPTTKKARSKPQVQDLNIDSLAKSNQLNKANTATLITWLKERGVICRSKDKKPDLIEKVRAHLNMSVSEP